MLEVVFRLLSWHLDGCPVLQILSITALDVGLGTNMHSSPHCTVYELGHSVVACASFVSSTSISSVDDHDNRGRERNWKEKKASMAAIVHLYRCGRAWCSEHNLWARLTSGRERKFGSRETLG